MSYGCFISLHQLPSSARWTTRKRGCAKAEDSLTGRVLLFHFFGPWISSPSFVISQLARVNQPTMTFAYSSSIQINTDEFFPSFPSNASRLDNVDWRAEA